jgi:caffeoyl-CoA O-methyltransferase
MGMLIDAALAAYAAEHSTQPGALMNEVERYTHTEADVADPNMVTGGLEAALLKLLVRLIGARRILEIGSFTGYSAIAMAEALEDDGKIISCEISEKHAEIAQSFIRRSPDAHKIEVRLGPAVETIPTLDGPFDLVFLDADKDNYCRYYELILPRLRTGGLIVADNVLWSGKVLNPTEKSDHSIVAFNQMVQSDPRVENVLLTVRDGVTLIRKL